MHPEAYARLPMSGGPPRPWRETSIPTEDPTTWIEDLGAGWVVYRSQDGDRWIVRGACNQCGACEPPDASYLVWRGPVGQPGACADTRVGQRRDVPVRPEAVNRTPSCSLNGEYLD